MVYTKKYIKGLKSYSFEISEPYVASTIIHEDELKNRTVDYEGYIKHNLATRYLEECSLRLKSMPKLYDVRDKILSLGLRSDITNYLVGTLDKVIKENEIRPEGRENDCSN